MDDITKIEKKIVKRIAVVTLRAVSREEKDCKTGRLALIKLEILTAKGALLEPTAFIGLNDQPPFTQKDVGQTVKIFIWRSGEYQGQPNYSFDTDAMQVTKKAFYAKKGGFSNAAAPSKEIETALNLINKNLAAIMASLKIEVVETISKETEELVKIADTLVEEKESDVFFDTEDEDVFTEEQDPDAVAEPFAAPDAPPAF